MSASMDQLIKLVNKLQDAFATVNVANPIDLPQIVVIGRYPQIKLRHCLTCLIARAVVRVQC